MRTFPVSPLLLSATLITASATALSAQTTSPSAQFHVDTLTAIPGHTLPPGDYTIRVVDHLSDRYVLAVDGSGGSHTLFLAVPKNNAPHKVGETLWKNQADGATYIRSWQFKGIGTPLEFVYPKNDAVAVAKSNGSQVPAIDPESDGMNTKSELTKDQTSMVTLWLLTPTAVGPSAPAGISAQKLSQVAQLERPKHLPRTASTLPLFWLFGSMALAGAAGVRVVRLTGSRG